MKHNIVDIRRQSVRNIIELYNGLSAVGSFSARLELIITHVSGPRIVYQSPLGRVVVSAAEPTGSMVEGPERYLVHGANIMPAMLESVAKAVEYFTELDDALSMPLYPVYLSLLANDFVTSTYKVKFSPRALELFAVRRPTILISEDNSVPGCLSVTVNESQSIVDQDDLIEFVKAQG